MATATDLQRIALSLAGTTEMPHFDRIAFKAARIYATLAANRRSANLKLSPEEQEFKCMLAPEAFSPVPNAWGKQGWTTVTLAKIKVAELKDVLETAWRHAVSTSRSKAKSTRALRKGSA
jgi:YjbR protein